VDAKWNIFYADKWIVDVEWNFIIYVPQSILNAKWNITYVLQIYCECRMEHYLFSSMYYGSMMGVFAKMVDVLVTKLGEDIFPNMIKINQVSKSSQVC